MKTIFKKKKYLVNSIRLMIAFYIYKGVKKKKKYK